MNGLNIHFIFGREICLIRIVQSLNDTGEEILLRVPDCVDTAANPCDLAIFRFKGEL